MNRNTWIWVIVIIILIILGVSLLGAADNDLNDDIDVNEVNVNGVNDNNDDGVNEQTPAAITVENEIDVSGQQTGRSAVVSFVALQDDGFIAIHESVNGQPGPVVGSSALISEGTATNVSLALPAPLVSGKTYIAMLHIDNGDRMFNEANDPSAKDSSGATVMEQFQVN